MSCADPDKIVIIGGIYNHCKGGLYKVLDIVKDSDNCKKSVVIYKQLKESDFPIGTRWARSYDDFMDNHSSGKKRFTLIGNDC